MDQDKICQRGIEAVSPEPRLIVHYTDEVLSLTAHDLERVKEAIGETYANQIKGGRTVQ